MTLFCVYKKLFCVFFSVLIRVTNHQTPAQPPTPANQRSSRPQPSFFFAPSFFPFIFVSSLSLLFLLLSLSLSSLFSLPPLFILSILSILLLSSFPSLSTQYFFYFLRFSGCQFYQPSVILCVYAGECWSDRTIPGVYTDSTPLPAS